MSTSTPSTTAALEPAYVKQRAAALVRDGRGAQVLIIRARPQWDGEPTITVRDSRENLRTVRICEGVSQLAILDAYAALPEDEYLVVLTDRSIQDLGDAVLLRAWRRSPELPDVWNAVPAMFGAHDVSRELRDVGRWVPNALLTHEPINGWPAAPGPQVDARWALENLIASLLGLAIPERLDPDLVLGALGEANARTAWNTVDPELRDHLIEWAADAVGPAVGFALRVGASGRNVAPLAVGLAVDVLWRSSESAVERGLAQARLLDRHLADHHLESENARVIAEASRASASRRILSDPDGARNVLTQTEALLADLGWAAGAASSELLPAGLTARLRALAESLSEGVAAAEAALDLVQRHALALPRQPDVLIAHMAVRLTRWLDEPEIAANTLSASLRAHVDDGAWVDRAVAHLWNASHDPSIAARYSELVSTVRARRRERDRIAAAQLEAHAAAPNPLDGAVPVEELLRQVVKPWSAGHGVLVVVLDGMSVAIATELAEAANELGLAEWVPDSRQRMSAVSALPSLTEVSRASLLSGALTTGASDVEKKGFATVFPQAQLFHKDELRSDAGNQLSGEVSAALADPTGVPVVGAVINAIDDTLHKQDTSGVEWTLDRLAPLRALLVAASAAGRSVVLTADHGHIVERSTEALSVPGAAARWRRADTGPVRDGEVHVSGPRVLTDDGQAVLLWRDDAHFGRRHPGYHGGASLAEVTVPVIVLHPVTVSGEPEGVAPGWIAAPPQTPEWWHEPARTAPSPPATPRSRQKSRETQIVESTHDALFDLAPPTAESLAPDLATAVVTSDVYAEQKRRAGRRAASDDQIVGVIRALQERGGRAHKDTVATVLGVPAAKVEPVLAMLKRVLNVDGYGVIELVDGGTGIKLNESLLREQFEVT